MSAFPARNAYVIMILLCLAVSVIGVVADVGMQVDLPWATITAPGLKEPATLDSVFKLVNPQSPTEVDHYRIQQTADVYMTSRTEDLGRVSHAIKDIVDTVPHAANMRVRFRGMVLWMQESFRSFAIGFSLSFVLLYLILVAQFRSFPDRVPIVLTIRMGFVGGLVMLFIMMVGMGGSNSILIRLRPILMTSPATIIGMIPMAPAAYIVIYQRKENALSNA